MKIRAEWAHLLGGQDKFGMGTQGDGALADLRRLNPSKVLFLDENLDTYAPEYGPRGALRTYHGTEKNWKDWDGWARHGAYHMSRCYGYGVRDFQPINEVWGIEGLGDAPEDYAWMGQEWTPAFLDAFERYAHEFGMPVHPEPDGIRIWLFGPTPGHNYEDNHFGLQHLAGVFRNPRVFGSIEHYYWEPWGGFLDGQWWLGPERLLKVRQRMLDLGINKPVWIGEWNRKVNRNDPTDLAAYVAQMRRFTQWVNSLDFVVWATYFLFNCYEKSTDFHDLTLTYMPDVIDRLTDPWDRHSEGEWAQPVEEEPMIYTTIGNGYQLRDRRGELPTDGAYARRDLALVRGIAIHHSGVDEPPDSDHALAAARYHVNTLGWPGVGYHVCINPNGTAELLNDLDRASYHVAGRNAELIGIELPGNFTTHMPTVAQLETCRRVVAELQYTLGWFAPARAHSEWALPEYPTSCPGATWPHWAAAVQVTAPEEPVEEPELLPRYVLGFADLAARLGPEVVGEPVEDERRASLIVQRTSRGIMLYEEGGQPQFFAEVTQ